MSEYFDTPVLVFACANKGELGDRARKLIAECAEPLSTPHALAECFNALTYRLGFPPRQVRTTITKNTERFNFVTMEFGDYDQAINLVVENGFTGDKIFDALHVVAAIKGKASKIHTSNKRDFGPMTTIPIQRIGP